ncbi:hypothetical protein ACO0M4_12445 [Streptomyces sp. RGM 3693]|uniref:hypothetical protein n=1 Tax=Streptomyces sp. RGM 3693 TaxID=3413284 RepID=UPI003D28CC80
MTVEENRELPLLPPGFPSVIIPALSGGETPSVALVDLHLCASLAIVVIIVVAAVVLLPSMWPAVAGVPGVWPFAMSAVVSLAGMSCRSYLRIVRARRG